MDNIFSNDSNREVVMQSHRITSRTITKNNRIIGIRRNVIPISTFDPRFNRQILRVINT